MTAAAVFFHLFALVMIASAFMVIIARNPVHAVLFLILTFVAASGLFLLIGAEFIGMMLIVVYVGAVAVLFLFVVMMLDVDFVALKSEFMKYLPLGSVAGVIMLAELVMIVGGFVIAPVASSQSEAPAGQGSNIVALGDVIYTKYVYYFEAAGLILLTAMIGAIVLTLRHKVGVKRQDIAVQNARTPADAIDLVQVKPGKGLQQAAE